MGTTQTYRTIEEVGNSTPREWRQMRAGLTALQAAKDLKALRNSSPSARFAEGETDGLLYSTDYDADGKLTLALND